MPSVPGRVLAQVSVHHSSPFTALVPAYFRRGDRYTAGGAWSVGDGSAGGQSKLGSNPQFQLAVLRQRTRVVATLTQSQADHRAKPHGIVLFIVYKKVLLRTHRVARLFADFCVIAILTGKNSEETVPSRPDISQQVEDQGQDSRCSMSKRAVLDFSHECVCDAGIVRGCSRTATLPVHDFRLHWAPR